MQPTSAGKPSLDHESLRQFPVSEREIDLLTVQSSCPNLRSSRLTMVVTATTTTTGKRVDLYHINTPAWCFWLSSFTFDLVPVDEPDADSIFSPSSSPWDHSMAPLSAAAKELVYFPLRQHEQVSADTQGTRDWIIFRRQACWKLHEQSHARYIWTNALLLTNAQRGSVCVDEKLPAGCQRGFCKGILDFGAGRSCERVSTRDSVQHDTSNYTTLNQWLLI